MQPPAQDQLFDGAPAQPCPRSPGFFFDPGRFRFTPAPCKSWRCERCASYMRGQWIARLETAHPQRFFTLTAIPSSQRTLWMATKGLFKDLRRRRDRSWEYFLTCDRNPKGTGLHLHGLQRGDFVPQRQLSRLAEAYGFGKRAHICSVEKVGGIAGYVTRHLVTRDLQIDPAIPRTRRVRYSRAFFPKPASGGAGDSDPGPEALRPRFIRTRTNFQEVKTWITAINELSWHFQSRPHELDRALRIMRTGADPDSRTDFDTVAAIFGADATPASTIRRFALGAQVGSTDPIAPTYINPMAAAEAAIRGKLDA